MKKYKDLLAVNDVSFTIEEGEMFGFLGPNGAGKTTIMRIIECVSPLTSGSLGVFGLDAIVAFQGNKIPYRRGSPGRIILTWILRCMRTRFSRYFDIPRGEA